MTVAIISHPACRDYAPGGIHPDRPDRLAAIEDQLIASGLEMVLRFVDAPEVTREQLERVHTGAYIDHLLALAPSEGRVTLDDDTPMDPATLPAARRAAGAGIRAVDGVLGGAFSRAFANVRPPGHHAGPDRGAGFCLFNNVAVAAAHALEHHGLERVAIVDFDVHHGDGTEAIFRDDARVMLCSAFQHPFYPFTGADTHSERIINVPLKAATGSEAYRAAVSSAWFDALEAFTPEMLFISAGFDGHREDDMSHLLLGESDYGWLTEALVEIADQHCRGRVVSMLEGGYTIPSLARSACEHVRALIG